MTTKGIIRGRMIELENDPPYPEGTTVSVEMAPVDKEILPPSEEAWNQFEALFGKGNSGRSDIAQNKDRYLAEAYADGLSPRPQAEE